MNFKIRWVFLLLFLPLFTSQARPLANADGYDVSNYDAALRVDIKAHSISGSVKIRLSGLQDNLSQLEFDAQELVVSGVHAGAVAQRYSQTGGHLVVELARPIKTGETLTLTIDFQGKPTKGMRFFPDQVYTFFNTSNWLVCHDQPYDKASITLRLTVPTGMTVVANGVPVDQKPIALSEVVHTWRQDKPVPTYTFGFVAGVFQELVRQPGTLQFHYLARGYTAPEVEQIFADSQAILLFFEGHAGVSYPWAARYTQVLAAGSIEQEMTGFTVLSEDYGREVLADAKEDWLVVHEFAHQWWGNAVTCRTWSDFWLNEGVVTFMTAAFKEKRFGRDEYDREMEIARRRYAQARDAGKDRPLVYYKWSSPSEMSGPITYSKGALILHLLRYEIGDQAFWKGLRSYTRANLGGSVTTEDLQTAMEAASGRNLTEFFKHWIYSTDLPSIVARQRIDAGVVVIEFEQLQKAIWAIPIQVAVETNVGRQTKRIILKERRQEIRFQVTGEVLSVRIDDGGNLPFRIAHERTFPMLLRQFMREPDSAGRIDALEQLQKICVVGSQTAECEAFRRTLAERSSQDSARLVRLLAKRVLDQIEGRKGNR